MSEKGVLLKGKKTKEIYEIIKKAGRIRLKEISALTDINYNTIRSAVINLTNYGLIERAERGVYKHKSK